MKNSTIIVLALAICSLGAVVATGAAPSGEGPVDEIDESDPPVVTLAPTNTANGDSYVSATDTGQLVVSVDVVAGVETDFDNLVVVTFQGVEGTDDSAQVWIQNSDARMDFYRMDTGGTVLGESNAVELSPDDSVHLGISVGGNEPIRDSFTQTVTYNADVPTVGGSSGGGSDGGSSSGGSGTGDGGTSGGSGDGNDGAGDGGGDGDVDSSTDGDGSDGAGDGGGDGGVDSSTDGDGNGGAGDGGGDGDADSGTDGDGDADSGTNGDGDADSGTNGDGDADSGTNGDGDADSGTNGDGQETEPSADTPVEELAGFAPGALIESWYWLPLAVFVISLTYYLAVVRPD